MKSHTVITDPSVTPIRPSHISTADHFWDSPWKNCETECSARILCKFAQEVLGDWLPFTKDQLDKFAEESFWFNRLRPNNGHDATDWIVERDDGKFYFTIEFIAGCYSCSPAKPVAVETAEA